MSVGKSFHFTEGKYVQAKVGVFNILNHANYALSNGNVFSTAGVTTATTTGGYRTARHSELPAAHEVLQRRHPFDDSQPEARVLNFSSGGPFREVHRKHLPLFLRGELHPLRLIPVREVVELS
jgi:hypothetical protein